MLKSIVMRYVKTLLYLMAAGNSGDILFGSFSPILVLVNRGSEFCLDSMVCFVCVAQVVDVGCHQKVSSVPPNWGMFCLFGQWDPHDMSWVVLSFIETCTVCYI
jgi:hypothetical protein